MKEFVYCPRMSCRRKSCKYHPSHIEDPEKEELFYEEVHPRCPKLMNDDSTMWCSCTVCGAIFTGTHKAIVLAEWKCPKCVGAGK